MYKLLVVISQGHAFSNLPVIEFRKEKSGFAKSARLSGNCPFRGRWDEMQGNGGFKTEHDQTSEPGTAWLTSKAAVFSDASENAYLAHRFPFSWSIVAASPLLLILRLMPLVRTERSSDLPCPYELERKQYTEQLSGYLGFVKAATSFREILKAVNGAFRKTIHSSDLNCQHLKYCEINNL
jgi:hypothetical protein